MQPDYSDVPRDQILCVDMKSFYASIELVKRNIHPLKGYLAVIGDKKRKGSVVLAASTALKKKYGIKTAHRLFQIPDKEEIILAEANMGLYLEVSMKITEIFNSYLPLEAIHIYSIDEAWLKLNGSQKKYGDPVELAVKIKKEIWDKYRLPCSMGIGPNMFMAKVAMDNEGKKTGLCRWDYEDIPDKLWPLKLSDCWGIGSRTEKKLNKIGVYTVGELAQLPLDYLENKFGIIGNQLYYHAWGIDYSQVEGHFNDRKKAVGRGITLYRDYTELDEIKTVIFNLAEEVTKRVRQNNLKGKTVSLSLGYSKTENKKGFSRQLSLEKRTDMTKDIYQAAVSILIKHYQAEKVRKISLYLTKFTESDYQQLNLFENDLKRAEINQLRDQLAQKMGKDVLYYARNLEAGNIKERIENTIGGHHK
ncbi:MAG: UV damage repair protein UvrX [Halanaerobium sp.]